MKNCCLVSNLGACRLLFRGLNDRNKGKNFRLNYEKQISGCTKKSDSISGRVQDISFSKASAPFTGLTQPLIKWLPEALFSEIKRLGVESWPYAATSTAVKKERIYNTTFHITPQLARKSFDFICIHVDNVFKNK